MTARTAVNSATLGRVGKSHVRLLRSHGWPDDQIRALAGDWPTLARSDVGVLASAAIYLTGNQISPQDCRGWMRIMHVMQDDGGLRLSPHYMTWRRVNSLTDQAAFAVAWTAAANGDPQVAQAAAEAGVTEQELRDLVDAGRADLDGLRMLAALR